MKKTKKVFKGHFSLQETTNCKKCKKNRLLETQQSRIIVIMHYTRILKTTFTTGVECPSMRLHACPSPGKNRAKVEGVAW